MNQMLKVCYNQWVDWNPNHEQEKHLPTLPQSQRQSSRRNELARRLQASLHSYQMVNEPHYPLIEWLLLTYNKVDEVAATEVDFIQLKTKNRKKQANANVIGNNTTGKFNVA